MLTLSSSIAITVIIGFDTQTRLIGHIPCFPHIYYGIGGWVQAAQAYLRNSFILQKRDLRLMFFAGSGSHPIPLFVSANILPLNMLCTGNHMISSAIWNK